ncbi:hypothetical protein JF66_17535 [Cryobacterium sp. MLB-32]|nr:hypothetical protein JF66_17535 [Cryobacterium sp. MLB-32]
MALAALISLSALGLGGYAAYTSIFGTSSGCLDTVTQVGEAIQVTEAGTVESSKTFDGGGVSACADPTMTVVLSGPDAATNIETNLAAAGFIEKTPGWWSRDDAYVTVESQSPGTTTVQIRSN